jgi:hypothetical protein
VEAGADFGVGSQKSMLALPFHDDMLSPLAHRIRSGVVILGCDDTVGRWLLSGVGGI